MYTVARCESEDSGSGKHERKARNVDPIYMANGQMLPGTGDA